MEDTIEILAEGNITLPKGTKIKHHRIGSSPYESVVDFDNISVYINKSLKNAGGAFPEVDFSSLPPLYPTKGMSVPAEGLEFADGGKVIDVGENGITYICDIDEEVKFYNWSHINKHLGFELKRTLPKTRTVKKCCFKEVCECVSDVSMIEAMLPKYYPQAEVFGFGGWKLKTIVFMSKDKEYVVTENGDRYCEFRNPINVIPEGEK